VPATVALEATGSFSRKEQHLAALCGVRYGVCILAISISVVRRIHRNNRSFECGESLCDIVDSIKGILTREGLRKEPFINRVVCDPAKKLVFMSFQPMLDRIRTKHGDLRLLFQRTQSWMGPCQQWAVTDVRQTHAASGMQLAGCAFRLRPPIGEG